MDKIEELKNLKDLLDKKLISLEQFNVLKKEILGADPVAATTPAPAKPVAAPVAATKPAPAAAPVKPTAAPDLGGTKVKEADNKMKASAIKPKQVLNIVTIVTSLLILFSFFSTELFWMPEMGMGGTEQMTGIEILTDLDKADLGIDDLEREEEYADYGGSRKESRREKEYKAKQDQDKGNKAALAGVFYFSKALILGILSLTVLILLASFNAVGAGKPNFLKNSAIWLFVCAMLLYLGATFGPLLGDIKFSLIPFLGPGFWLMFCLSFVLLFTIDNGLKSENLEKNEVYWYPSFWAGLVTFFLMFIPWYPLLEVENGFLGMNGITTNGSFHVVLSTLFNDIDLSNGENEYFYLKFAGMGIMLLTSIVLFFDTSFRSPGRAVGGIVLIIGCAAATIFSDGIENKDNGVELGTGVFIVLVCGIVIAIEGYAKDTKRGEKAKQVVE